MTIEPFSKHIFWSYKPDADLPERVVIQQVIAYGEITDIRLISKMVPHQVINEAIEKWKEKKRYLKRINFIRQIFLYQHSDD